MKQGLIFASARAKVKELNLFTEERLHRMIEAKDIVDAVRILAEANYGGGISITADNFYDALIEEERLTTEFLKEVSPKGVGIECFFMMNDYHNLKVLMKAKYTDNDNYENMLLPDGNFHFGYLKEKFLDNKIIYINAYMGEALKNISKSFETDGISPRRIDVEIDKAMYKEITDTLKSKDADKYIKEYFTVLIDTTNIGTLIRTVETGGNFEFFADSFIEGGEIGFHSFKECGLDLTKFGKMIGNTRYKNLSEKALSGDICAFEVAKDNTLIKIFATNKEDMFSVAPFVGYYLGKLNEIKVIRVVLICIKNKVSSEEMKKRVRVLYA